MSRSLSRRNFIKKTGSVIAAAGFGFPNLLLPKNKKEKLGVALVGLGSYSRGRLAPGLQLTRHCELRGIVTGTPSKIPVWQQKYGIPDGNVYNYENMHQIADNDDIDIVYIVLPTGLHAKYAIIGANAGKHVFCEKPMAMNTEECQAVIDAASKNGVYLTIGYRMQHEPNTQTIIRYGESKTYGELREVRTGAGYNGGYPEGYWRLDAELGGGALYDMGVYPINAARYATGMEAVALKGNMTKKRKEMFKEVDETTTFELKFPNGIKAFGETSFGKSMNYLDVDAANGWYRLRPFQSYSGVQGETSDGTKLPPDPNHQQARQMDNDARAIKEGRMPIVPGEEGLRDIRIVNAIQESSRLDGEWISLH